MKKLLLLAMALSTFTGRAQLTNPGFEDWTQDPNMFDPLATGWNLYPNTYNMEISDGFCYQMADAQQGNYAMGVSVWYYYVKTLVAQRAPVSQRHTQLEGYYTYTDNVIKSLFDDVIVTDTAQVLVYMTKWNAATMQEDTIGHGRLDLHEEATQFTHFNCPIAYVNDEVPDQVIVIFDPSIVRRDEDGPYYISIDPTGRNSYFTVDNLSLGTTMDIGRQNRLNVTLYPNPASGHINIGGVAGDFRARITDVTGKTVAKANLSGTNAVIPVQDLASGLYVVQVEDTTGRVATQKFVKE